MMQAQVLTAVVKEMKIVRTINYGQKYITDLKYVNKGKVCVSVVNKLHEKPFLYHRGDSISCFSTYGSCLCFTWREYPEDIIYIFSDNRSLILYDKLRNKKRIWPQSGELSTEYTPSGIAACKSQAILVCLWNHQVHERSLGKVLKLSIWGEKFFEIETDKNRPLFICPTYITENGNEDICVSDVNAVVVTDAGGFLRFRYRGTQSDPQFDPYGICCDSKNNIIVADTVKNRIHMIDQNGGLLHYINYSDMHMPRALCIDEGDNLYVGEWLSEEIKVLSLQ
ncbi:uncharacterized protein LOC133189465 [Saccostrea echinata]|uniref:uncharacterized protein LOC133189465 n=1 Tax=Saccostrea echinata TaxID=191078 RepID=UPI002A835C4F|nr:uncharacterized protein LOC133189465 [Saccostrea echinata]